MHCSESDDMTDKFCQIMIGYAVKTNRLYSPEEMTDPLRSNPNSKARGWAIVTRDKETKKITKFFTRDVQTFNKKQA